MFPGKDKKDAIAKVVFIAAFVILLAMMLTDSKRVKVGGPKYSKRIVRWNVPPQFSN